MFGSKSLELLFECKNQLIGQQITSKGQKMAKSHITFGQER